MVSLSFLILWFCFMYTAEAQQEYVYVNTSNGIFMGLKDTTIFEETFYAFLGIKYAEPPVGYLRFKDPVPIVNRTGIYNATKTRSICTQYPNITLVNLITPPNGTEDCLHLNVYTPMLPSNEVENPKLPCIVWIHGGGFIYGSGNIGLHGADRFLKQNVTMVTINYRLGVFGFLSTEDNASPGNYGLKDQILALKWVQDNIAYFGGDPKQVTIMGESAGSVSVHYLIQSKAAKGLFVRAIAESGSTLNPWSAAPNARTLAFRIGLVNGIVTKDSRTLIEDLRKVQYIKLIKSSFAPALLTLWDPLNGLPFSPSREDGLLGAVVSGSSFEKIQRGKFNHVPLLHGFNSLEGRDASTLPWVGNLYLEQYNLFPSKLTPKDMNATKQGADAAGRNISRSYFPNGVKNDADLAYYVSDDEFVRGINRHAQFYAKYAKCYLYKFSFTGGSEHKSFQPEGVAHAEELQFLFWSKAAEQRTPAARLTSERMVQMWANFAKSGDPTYKLTEEVNVTWPLVNATGGFDAHYLNINYTLQPSVNPQADQMKYWDTLYNIYGFPPYNTY